MPYSLPVGTANLALTGSYSLPTGTADLPIGATSEIDRSLTLAGDALAPIGLLRIAPVFFATGAGESLAPTGRLELAYDPNLLSAVHAVRSERWQPGDAMGLGSQNAWQESAPAWLAVLSIWQPAALKLSAPRSLWNSSERLTGSGVDVWQEAGQAERDVDSRWQQTSRLNQVAVNLWQEARSLPGAVEHHWRGLPRLIRPHQDRWQAGLRIGLCLRDRFQEGAFLTAKWIEVWQQAGYPGNARNSNKDIIPTPIPTSWGTNLRLLCPLPGTALRIGRVPCILLAEREVVVQRSYMSVNSASLVRWPDLTPLPCTAMTIETDFNSWCWALSATLAGDDAWALVQPNPLACEVLATINGQQWKFLLDIPSTNRAFNSDRVTLKGRSRSAWLHSPYTPSRSFTEANAREMVQLAEAAIDNTGWTVDWQIPNWLVPAGRYNSWNTPIGALIRLVNTTDDGLYTDPILQVLYALPRWPVASWLIDGEVADVLIPEAAIITLSQAPLYTQPLNGVYVSGESHGVLGFVKIAGTDGALQPSDPIVNELLCDTAGVAARQRGLNALSDSGSGFTMDAETLFLPPTFELIRPGLVVSIAGMKGVSRAVRVSAAWSNDGLQVKQSIEFERREVES